MFRSCGNLAGRSSHASVEILSLNHANGPKVGEKRENLIQSLLWGWYRNFSEAGRGMKNEDLL